MDIGYSPGPSLGQTSLRHGLHGSSEGPPSKTEPWTPKANRIDLSLSSFTLPGPLSYSLGSLPRIDDLPASLLLRLHFQGESEGRKQTGAQPWADPSLVR